VPLLGELTGGSISNSWDVFVYPENPESQKPENVLVTSDMKEAKAAFEKGGSVLWMPPAKTIRNDSKRPLIAGFSPIFWNTAWTKWQPPHTLGIICDPKHPAFEKFPTDMHSNWQWWEIQQNAQPFILTDLRDVKPVVQVIDDWFTNRRLAYVFEARVGKGKLIACGADLTQTDQRPAARQLLASLLNYMDGAKFEPSVSITLTDLEGLIGP